MTFTPPTKRTHGECSPTCHSYMASPQRAGMNGHSADCPALYPLQPQPGDNAMEPATQTAEQRAKTIEDANRLLAARVQHLEARLKDYERAAVLTNDHQSRALRMGQEQGRADLAAEVVTILDAAATRMPPSDFAETLALAQRQEQPELRLAVEAKRARTIEDDVRRFCYAVIDNDD